MDEALRKLAQSVKVIRGLHRGAGGEIPNPMSVFPKPQRMFPDDAPVKGGQYLSMPDKTDMTGHKSAAASIGVAEGGKPFFTASRDAVDETGTSGRGSAIARTNLFKQKAGWKWKDAPEGHENTNTIVSVEHRGQHHYALNAHFPKGVDLARYEDSPSEPRLRPTTRGNVEFGPQAGSILVRGREHPVYHHVIVKNAGGDVEGYATKGAVTDPLEIAKGVKPAKRVKAQSQVNTASNPWESWPTTNYQSWDDVPIIDPQDLVGKKVGSLLADLTRAGGHFSGIDSSKLSKPEPMYGGPGYSLLPSSQLNKLGWAVQGKGRGTAKLNKGSDYIAVHAMNQNSHLSNTSLVNSIIGNLQAYVRDKRITPEAMQQLDSLIKKPSNNKELKKLQNFPGFNDPNISSYLHSIGFPARLQIAKYLGSAKAEKLGAPSVDKIQRDTLDKDFAGVPYGHAGFLLEMPKGSADSLVRLGQNGLPNHTAFDWGMHGRIVGKFAHPVAPEILHQPFFDRVNEENKTKKTAKGRPPNARRAFEVSLPSTLITQEIADKLPRRPIDIQSGKSAQLALNAFNDQWHDTDTPVKHGGLGTADLSRAIRNSDSSSTLSQYSEKELNDMKKAGKFTGYKLKDGEVYFGLKHGTNYADEYGFHHPDLTDNETALTSVVNNEPGAKGIGGAPVVLKALQHGATALDAYAVPTDKHPNGFLPDFYSHFGFEELGRVPFDPKYVTPQQYSDMKHEWAKTGWDEQRHGLPSLAIMKWRGSDADRPDAVRRFVTQGGEGFGPRGNRTNVRSANQLARQGAGESVAAPQGERGNGDTSGNRGPVGANYAPRPADRFTRTLAAVKSLSPSETQHFGLNPADIQQAKVSGLATGGSVRRPYKKGGKVEGSIWHERDAFDDGGKVHPDLKMDQPINDTNEHMSKALRLVQSMGRGNDTILAHINPREAKLLKKRGGSGKINPRTGLLEFDDSGSGDGGGDNVRADSVSQSEQSSADQAARQDTNDSNENAASVRMGSTVGGLSADTGDSAGPAVGQSQGDVNAAIAAAQNAQQGLASMSNAFGSPNATPSLVGGNSNLSAVADAQSAMQSQLNALAQQSATDVTPNPSAGLPNLADVGATNYSFNTTGLNANGELNPTMGGGLSAQLAQAAGADNAINNPSSYNTAAQALQGEALTQMQAQQAAEFNAPIPNDTSNNNPIRLGGTPNTGVAGAAPEQSLASILGQNLAPTTTAYTPPAATAYGQNAFTQPNAPHTETPNTAYGSEPSIGAPAPAQLSSSPVPMPTPRPADLNPTENMTDAQKAAQQKMDTGVQLDSNDMSAMTDAQRQYAYENGLTTVGTPTGDFFGDLFSGKLGYTVPTVDTAHGGGDGSQFNGNQNTPNKTHMVQKLMPDGTYQWVEQPFKKGGKVYRPLVGSQMTDHVISKFGVPLSASKYQPNGNKAGRR